MPLVRIDLSKTQPKGLAQKVGDIIFQAMRDEINERHLSSPPVLCK